MTERDKLRFWEKVQKSDDDACWLWKYKRAKGPRAAFCYAGRTHPSARIMWQLTNGDPGKLFVLHRCDNPDCVNPAHLFLGTHKDNMQDKARKRRSRRDDNDESRHRFKQHENRIF